MNTNDLINFAAQRKPVEMADAFNDLMAEKIASRLDALRPEVTMAMLQPNGSEEFGEWREHVGEVVLEVTDDRSEYTDLEKFKKDAKDRGLHVRKETSTKTYDRHIALHPVKGIVGFFHNEKPGQTITRGKHGGVL